MIDSLFLRRLEEPTRYSDRGLTKQGQIPPIAMIAVNENKSLTFLTHLVSASDPVGEMTPLAEDFQPGSFDCICGRGKKSYNHEGNRRFREGVLQFLQTYSKATSKLEKSLLVSSVVESVRNNSPKGGFVKYVKKTNRWYEVGDHLAREKVGQAFRDALHDQYRSSTESKRKRRNARKAVKVKASSTIFSKSKRRISSKIQELSNAADGTSSENNLWEEFNKINFEILMEFNCMAESGASVMEIFV